MGTIKKMSRMQLDPVGPNQRGLLPLDQALPHIAHNSIFWTWT